jgi:hypothetical protein
MNDFDQVLDDSIKRIAGATATADECLADHPEHSAQLKPLLETANRIERGRELYPSDAYKHRARGQLMEHLRINSNQKTRKPPLIWTAAISLAVVVIAFFVTGTALAQSALPGQMLYNWKLSSEQIWRVSSPDRIGVDLELANRRTVELTAVNSSPTDKSEALAGYQEVLNRLNSENDAKNNDRILMTLKSNQQKLSASGIIIPELNKHLAP